MVPASPRDKRGYRRNSYENADDGQIARWEGDNRRLSTYPCTSTKAISGKPE